MKRRITITDLEAALERKHAQIKGSKYHLVLGGDIAGVTVYEADERYYETGAVCRTLHYGATKREALETIHFYYPPDTQMQFGAET